MYDTIFFLIPVKQFQKPENFGHHIISIIVWPYAVLRGRMAFYVVYFCFTEITSTCQHSCTLLSNFGLKDRPIWLAMAVTWMVFFFIVRILPIPWFVYSLVTGDYHEFSTLDLCVTMCTV